MQNMPRQLFEAYESLDREAMAKETLMNQFLLQTCENKGIKHYQLFSKHFVNKYVCLCKSSGYCDQNENLRFYLHFIFEKSLK